MPALSLYVRTLYSSVIGLITKEKKYSGLHYNTLFPLHIFFLSKEEIKSERELLVFGEFFTLTPDPNKEAVK